MGHWALERKKGSSWGSIWNALPPSGIQARVLDISERKSSLKIRIKNSGSKKIHIMRETSRLLGEREGICKKKERNP